MMRRKRVDIGHDRDGFVLRVAEESVLRAGVVWAAFCVCNFTRNRFCHRICSPVNNWAYSVEDTLYEARIDRDTALRMSSRDAFDYLDD